METEMEKELGQECLEMPFGRKVRVGNFEVIKITRSLSRHEMRMLRDVRGVPRDVQKHLSRGGLPYIVVSTISGSWSVSFVVGSAMYMFIEQEVVESDEDEGVLDSLHNLFTMMYADTSLLGDGTYLKAKARALKSFMGRCKPKRGKSSVETAEEKAADDAVLKDLQAAEETLGRAKEMITDILDDEQHR